MTQSDEALVTQADREAAAAICSALLGAYATNSLNPQILAGKHDNHMHVQIVAHHRIEALTAKAEATQRQQLPITAMVHALAGDALKAWDQQ